MKVLLMALMITLTSCGTTKYVHTDKVNYKRFKHDQKIKPGMSQKEVMGQFGSPDIVEHKFRVGQGVVAFQYYRKIFCKDTYCYIYFNNQGEVMFTHGIRMEFDKTLVSDY